MECSRDSCHHMRYIDCSSAMILGTFRLLSAPDPPWTGRLDQKKFSSSRLQRVSRRCIYMYIDIDICTTHHIFRKFFFWSNHGPLSVLCICVLETFWNGATDSRHHHGLFLSLKKQRKKMSERSDANSLVTSVTVFLSLASWRSFQEATY